MREKIAVHANHAVAAPPWRLNFGLTSAFVSMHLIALTLLPAIHVSTPILWVVCVSIGLSTTPMWALIHEAIHGLLLPQPGANALAGRALAIMFGAPFRALRFAHLRHHRYNRSPCAREEVYDPLKQKKIVAYFHHYVRITVGLYFGEIALLFLCFLPRAVLRKLVAAQCPAVDGTPGMAAFADRDILSVGGLREIRIDAFLTLTLFGAAVWLYADRWFVLLGLFGVRSLLISQVDHAFHHGTPLDEKYFALNLSLPRWAERWMLNFNRHRAHHCYPQLPWKYLPAHADRCESDMGFLRGVLRQWKGPIAITHFAARDTKSDDA